MSEARTGELELMLSLFGPLRLRCCPWRPTARQEAFLLLRDKEVFFGGGAGGGKSVAMLMAALQYCDVPGYRALVLRPSQSEFLLGGGLLDLAHQWLGPTKAHWSSDTNTWRFPGPARAGADGATLTFGYLANRADLGRYHGSSYAFLGFDELTRFDEQLYRRMFRVLRQPTSDSLHAAAPDGTTLGRVPARIRSTSNPGGPGHTWVKNRFVDPATRHPDAIYLPSRLEHNPHLDQASYTATLGELPSAERQRLLQGDWEIPDDGELFQRDWFDLIEPHQLPDTGYTAVRAWDLAATEPSSRNRDPDWTVGLLLYHHRTTGSFYIANIIRVQRAPGAVEQLVADTAQRDGKRVAIVIEQEPGSSGKAIAERYKRHVLPGYRVKTQTATGPKDVRAWAAAAAAENGLIKIVRGRHTDAFLDELTAFPHAGHDDCVDALAAAHSHALKTSSRGTLSYAMPTGRIDIDPTAHHRSWAERRYPRDIEGERLSAILGIPLHPAPPPGIQRARQRPKP